MVKLGRFLLTMLVVGMVAMTLGCNVSISISPADSAEDGGGSQSDPTSNLNDSPFVEVVELDQVDGVASTEGLRIEKHAEEFMLIINQTSQTITLRELRLTNDRGAIDGSDWGVDEFATDACIAVWKQRGNTQPPSETECDLVGNIPVEPPVFWEKPLDVYYEGVQIGTCGENQNPCLVILEK